uniref:Phosphatidic acid phosphatase type 2/haloperoxidase domain-containing protein n=1 Tax=Timema bartmani TaxID=61472 RepID=A0A7R9EZZ9_9NEOP|nr:unnamed protein product [Timema bartmani]
MRLPEQVCVVNTTNEKNRISVHPIGFELQPTELVAVSFAILFTYLFAVPFRRGFFCDDESIRHPHKPRVQVPDAVVASIALAIPLIIFMVLESVRHGLRTPGRYRIFGKTPPQWLVQLGTLSKVFLGGAAFNQITVDVGKYCLGRLRPHFLTVCLPDVLTTCITSTDHSYITDYLCTGADKDVIQEARYIVLLQYLTYKDVIQEARYSVLLQYLTYKDVIQEASTPDRDSNLDLPVIGSLVYCESSALDHISH